MQGNTALIVDIGGTNARFALVDGDKTTDILFLECRHYAGLEEAILDYYARAKITTRPKVGILAVAGPVGGDVVTLTNLSWTFRISKIQETLGFQHFRVINDFEAIALSIPALTDDHLVKIGGGDVDPVAPKAIIGPGTGLGVASLVWTGSRYAALPGEGGHVTMPAVNEREFAIFQQLHVKYTHISAERVCSGKGLENLYNAIRVLDGRLDAPDLEAPQIGDCAVTGKCPICVEALDLMLAFLGRVSGNLGLTLKATGGIYIAGGIPGKLGDYFFKSRFLEELHAKGRMSDLAKQMPVFLVTHDAPALVGLAHEARFMLRATQ
jgi:glucokinase